MMYHHRLEVGSVAVHARVVNFSLQVNSDLYIFGETVKDYIALLASIKVEDFPFSLRGGFGEGPEVLPTPSCFSGDLQPPSESVQHMAELAEHTG